MMFFRKAMSAFVVTATLLALVPNAAFAATQSAPSNLTLVNGVYTNDTTPTATWTKPSGATWYEILVDNGTWQSIGNVSSYTLWPLQSGWHTFFLRAHNNSGNVSTSVSVTFEIDIQGPTVTTVSPSTATEGAAVTFAITAFGESAATFCDLYINRVNTGGMTKHSSTSFKKVFTFNDDGSYTVYARCADGDGNYTTGPSRSITVANDDDEPTENETFWVNGVTPTSATEDESTTMRVTTSGTLNAATCLLYVNGSSVGTMSEPSNNSFSKSYTFSNNGSYTVYALCQDEQGNWDRGDSKTVTVSEDDEDETFTVPYVTPTSVREDEEETFRVTPYGTLDAETCKLYVNGSSVGTMDESGGTFRIDHTFSNDGSYTVYAYCEDENGDWTKGSSHTVTVNEEDNNVKEGSLIKTACGATTTVNDPCKAVYYYGEDGKRHVFPNEATYFTWYNDFDDVVEVSSSFMSSLTIGKNVTFRPGSVLVKFDSSSSIYAVEKDHTLRRYTKTSLIESDYGDDYEDVLVTISDSLYSNYSIGSVIDSTNDFDRSDEYYSVDSIDDVL
jgi:hypothetical protein